MTNETFHTLFGLIFKRSQQKFGDLHSTNILFECWKPYRPLPFFRIKCTKYFQMAATTSSETKTDKFCKNFDCQEQTFEYKIWI